ncbi:MAG TPA: 3-oxoacyl-[acyl-carrier-protein] synthase III C-terminal domain-containing protein [Steroidobacter sp.]|nr:3-oxoacyl-[acyl-carrier-protein] synthase III C-terminal domain-containing protein [Steroidobacter sp.]
MSLDESTGNHSATIAATATAVPPHLLTREDVKTYIRKVFDIGDRRLDAMMTIIDNAQVRQRHAIFPVEYIVTRRSLEKTSAEYQHHSVALGRQAAEACLATAGMTASDIDLIITVSCTGFMIPSLDAHLINLMGFRSNVRRLPLTELGCAAGAMALAQAWEFVRAFPGRTVLIVSVELPTLTFQGGDSSQANLISSVLFGDGAAAAIVTGRSVRGPQIVDAETYTFPSSLDAMGFDLRDDGFHIVLSKDVPQMIRDRIRQLADDFLRRSCLTRENIAAYILHPGGQKLLSYVEQELGLCHCETELSWQVLAEYGNLSSATILFILHACLTRNRVKSGEYGLAAAFGPGFSSELLLLRWS